MAEKLCGVPFQGKDIFFLIFFFSFSVRELKFNTSLWKVPALEGLRVGGGELAGRARRGADAAAPRVRFLCCWISGEGGGVCFFFSSFLNKALKWEVDPIVFITVLTFVLIHFRN